MADPHRSGLLAFNTVERVFRGDFFHCVNPRDVREHLAEYPEGWTVLGLGTTNRQGRHGEVFLDGTAGAPRFVWADPAGEDGGSLVELSDHDPMPFLAAGVCDPDTEDHEWTLAEGEDIAAAIAARCEAANIGLAALLVHGAVTVVDYQVMCHIPLNGVRAGDKPVAQKRREGATSWNAIGIYAANPTVRSVVSHGVAAVHLHGRLADPLRGGHVNSATVGEGSSVRVFPLRDLVVRISDLDVAVHDNRP